MKRISFVPAILLAAQVCFGQVSSGRVEVGFDRFTAPVWDIGGGYAFEHTADSVGNLETPVNYGVTIGQDNKSRLRSDGDTIVQIGTDVVAAQYQVNGNVYNKKDATRAVFTVRLNGNDVIAGERRKFEVSLKYDCTIDPEDLALVGTVRGSVSANGIGSSRIEEDVTLPLPPGVDGSWTIVMDIAVLDKIAGTGVISISRWDSGEVPGGEPIDRELPARLSGSYSEKKGTTRLNVKGFDEGKGSSVQLELDDELQLTSMKGTVLGQKVRLPE